MNIKCMICKYLLLLFCNFQIYHTDLDITKHLHNKNQDKDNHVHNITTANILFNNNFQNCNDRQSYLSISTKSVNKITIIIYLGV